MPKEPNPNDMENLSKAIVEAILGSDEVSQALGRVNMSVEGFGKNFMVFVVNLDSLADAKKKEKERLDSAINEADIKPKRRRPAKKENSPDIIDGKLITENEKKFQDFLSENFDSESWLKNLKLRLE
jgi:hypothetical protein